MLRLQNEDFIASSLLIITSHYMTWSYSIHSTTSLSPHIIALSLGNDLTIGWKNLNLLSHPNAATLAPQAGASGENLNYMTLAWHKNGKPGLVVKF